MIILKNYVEKILVIAVIFYFGGISMAQGEIKGRKHIVLLGASVGKAWNIESLPKRLSQSNPTNPSNLSREMQSLFHWDPTNPKNSINYRFEYVGLYQFDKSLALEQLLNRKQNKPHAIILKECAAYFPSDITFEKAKNLMEQWIAKCQEKGVVPIPTTVVPVTLSHDEKFKTHNPIKRVIKRILGVDMRTRMERIIEYNDWIKQYSKEKGLVVLDLENPLRISPTDRFLRNDLTKGDGLHLNAEAYRLLDGIVIPTLEKIKFPN